MTNIKLIEAFGDFTPRIRSDTNTPRSHVKKLILKNPNIRLVYKTLEKKIKDLQTRYPDKGYYLEKKIINDLMYWRFGRRGDSDSRKKLQEVPLYYSPRFMSLFIPSSYIKKKKRLVSSVLMYRLKWLGISYSLVRVR